MDRTDLQRVAEALHRIAQGDSHGPSGLELVAMALAGDGLHDAGSVAKSLDRVADGLQAIASAIDTK